MAIAIPVDGGYLSVRLKPSSPLRRRDERTERDARESAGRMQEAVATLAG